VALLVTPWLPISSAEEQEAIDASAESAVAALVRADEVEPEPEPKVEPDREPEPAPVLVRNGPAANGLERIATLLEEIEARRELEARRQPF
jgi:hypothetical protein